MVSLHGGDRVRRSDEPLHVGQRTPLTVDDPLDLLMIDDQRSAVFHLQRIFACLNVSVDLSPQDSEVIVLCRRRHHPARRSRQKEPQTDEASYEVLAEHIAGGHVSLLVVSYGLDDLTLPVIEIDVRPK